MATQSSSSDNTPSSQTVESPTPPDGGSLVMPEISNNPLSSKTNNETTSRFYIRSPKRSLAIGVLVVMLLGGAFTTLWFLQDSMSIRGSAEINQSVNHAIPKGQWLTYTHSKPKYTFEYSNTWQTQSSGAKTIIRPKSRYQSSALILVEQMYPSGSQYSSLKKATDKEVALWTERIAKPTVASVDERRTYTFTTSKYPAKIVLVKTDTKFFKISTSLHPQDALISTFVSQHIVQTIK